MGIDPIGLATQHIKRVTVLHTTRARKCNILWKEGLKYTLSAMYESMSVDSTCKKNFSSTREGDAFPFLM